MNQWVNKKEIWVVMSHSLPWTHKSFLFGYWKPGRNVPSATGQKQQDSGSSKDTVGL